MVAKEPTIVATCTGLRPGAWDDTAYGPVMLLAIELACVQARAPRLAHINTAGGDPRALEGQEVYAARAAGVEASHLRFFPRRSAEDLRQFILAQDVLWVGGGSVSNLLAIWRLHGLDQILREAWERGIVLAGGSAGGICWHRSGVTTSFGPTPTPVLNGLDFLPWSFTPHYDSDPGRRAALHAAVSSGAIDDGYAVDEGVGLVYRGDVLSRIVSDSSKGAAYHVRQNHDGSVKETRLNPDQLI